MKLSTSLILASLGSASAFMAPASKVSSSLRMASEMEPESMGAMEEVETLPEMSQSLPFMAIPSALDGTLAGDVGFDPSGFAKNSEDLIKYHEAEIKHVRLAMLAAAGWPLSELFDTKIANLFGMTPVLDTTDRAPSLLNGGLLKISLFYWIVCFAGAAAIDLFGIMNASKKA
jgi:hypothetical protein